MLGHDPYYHHMTRKYIIAFAKLFEDIKVQRFDSNGIVQKTIDVPVTYAGKSKIFYLLNKRTDLNTKIINQVLPRISFIITGATINSERMMNNLNTMEVSSDGTTESLMYSGTPYDFSIIMSVWGKNMDDVLQIFEQIVPFFKPDYTITLNEIKELNISRNVPVVLNDVQFDITSDLDESTDRNIFADITFTLQGYLYPPITNSKIIKMIDVNFREFETLELLSNINIKNEFSATMKPIVDNTDNIEITFSEQVDPLTVTNNGDGTGSFEIYDETNSIWITGVITTDNFTFIFNPDNGFISNTNYTINLNNTIHASGSFYIYDGYNFSFLLEENITYDSIWDKIISPTGDDKDNETIAFGNGLYVILTSNRNILTSSDAYIWNLQTTTTPYTMYDLTYGNGLFVAVGVIGNVITSTDGINWETQVSPTTQTLKSITYGDGLFVAVGWSGNVITSTDGINWETQVSPTTEPLYSINYGNGLFVAVGGWGVIIITSTDGINWETQVSPTTEPLYSITYGNGLFVAGGWSGNVITSTDGINWETQVSPTTQTLKSITYGDGLFVAGAIYSTDGINWINNTTPANESLNKIIYTKPFFIAAGDYDSIFKSEIKFT